MNFFSGSFATEIRSAKATCVSRHQSRSGGDYQLLFVVDEVERASWLAWLGSVSWSVPILLHKRLRLGLHILAEFSLRIAVALLASKE